jgi:hypothetical protein
MPYRLPYASQRLAAAIDRFLRAQQRDEKAAAARWVSAWSHFIELYSPEALDRRMRQEPALASLCRVEP